VKYCIGAVTLAASIFAFGVYAGQIDTVKDLFGVPVRMTAQAPNRQTIESRIDELTRGYNERMTQLRQGVIDEERAAAATTYSTDREPHEKAAGRLRDEIRKEEESYLRSLDALRRFIAE
jgi:hypothetical protein